MAFSHEPLTEAELGPGAFKVCKPDAPPRLRAMVAKGLAPLGPRDLVVALYQLWVDNEDELAPESAKTVEGLPHNIIGGALEDPQLPPGVLDFLARKLPRNEDVLQRVVQHANVHDETLASVARICPEKIADILAQNQQRWLRAPIIVENLYQNPNCRMSVVQRMLELAVREGVELKLPNMDEIKAALGDVGPIQPERDEVFRDASAGDVARAHEDRVDRMRSAAADEAPDLDEDEDSSDLDLQRMLQEGVDDDMSLPLDQEDQAEEEKAEEPEDPNAGRDRLAVISQLRPMEKIRLALLGNTFERAVLIRDANKSVALSAIKSPKVKENEVIAYAANRALSHDVVRYIARRRDWAKLYAVKLNLVLNPKTPMAQAMTFLGHLHAHDVRKVARSRNIPSALAQAAKRRAQARR